MISSPLGKLRMRNPSVFAGPQPQQTLFGAYFSWRDLSLIMDRALRSLPAVEGSMLKWPGKRSGQKSKHRVRAVRGGAWIGTQFWSHITRARTDQSIMIVLLDNMRAPAGHTRS